jgi:uncharacterized protein (TIGR02996 family)
MLMSIPLESFLRNLPSRPAFRFQEPGYQRGYLGSWEVRSDDALWLTGLRTVPQDEGADPGLRLVFPDATGPVPATWVRQSLQIAEGERRYDPIGYVSTYTRETRLAVSQGRLVMVEEIDVRSKRVIESGLTPHLEEHFGAEESAFLRAVRTALNDVAPRLVYADWLDERNDARGELIRIVERLRGLAPDVAARERAAYRERIRGGDWLWNRIMAYDAIAQELWPSQIGWQDAR